MCLRLYRYIDSDKRCYLSIAHADGKIKHSFDRNTASCFNTFDDAAVILQFRGIDTRPYFTDFD